MSPRKLFIDTRLLLPTRKLLKKGRGSLLDLGDSRLLQSSLEAMVRRGAAEAELIGDARVYVPTKIFLRKLTKAEPEFVTVILNSTPIESAGDPPEGEPPPTPAEGPQPNVSEKMLEAFAEAGAFDRDLAEGLVAEALIALSGWVARDRFPFFLSQLAITSRRDGFKRRTVAKALNQAIDLSSGTSPLRDIAGVGDERSAIVALSTAVHSELLRALDAERALMELGLTLLEAAALVLDASGLSDYRGPVDHFRKVRTLAQKDFVEAIKPFFGAGTEFFWVQVPPVQADAQERPDHKNQRP